MGMYQTFLLDDTSGGGMMNLPPEMAQGGSGPAWLFYITVEDIKEATGRVKAGGGTVTHGPVQVPGGSWILQATDAQGGTFALTAAK